MILLPTKYEMKTNLIILVLFIFSGCQTYLNYTVPTPPVVNIDKPSSFLLFNRFDPHSVDFTVENKIQVHVDGIQALKLALKTSFEKDPRYSLIVIDSVQKGLAASSFSNLLDQPAALDLCYEYKTDYLITIDFYHPRFDMVKVVEEDEDGKSITNNTDLILDVGFTLYNRDGRIIEQGVSSEILDYRNRPALTEWLYIDPSIGKAGDEINELSLLIGNKYINLFYPGEFPKSDLYYVGKGFKDITPLMKAHRWKEAEEKLLELANSGDPKLSERAKYNLILVYDAMGNEEKREYYKRESTLYTKYR